MAEEKKPKNRKKLIVKILVALVVIFIVQGVFVLGAFGGMGPLKFIKFARDAKLPGNAEEYSFEYIEPMEDSPLEGANILVLGSSVVDGVYSNQFAIAEYLGARMGCTYTKEALSGTTLADTNLFSYVRRLQGLDTNAHYDLFVCQLSTNDATQGIPLGELSQDGTFDLSTTTGAMEFIITYVQETWGCPVVFFTGSHYDSEAYDAMVSRLYELKDKYGIIVIDLWNDESFNSISDDVRAIYMYDEIHPTKAGYRDWWGPEIERQLCEALEK